MNLNCWAIFCDLSSSVSLGGRMSQIESEMSVDLVDMEAGLGKKIKSFFHSLWRARSFENMNANIEKCRSTKEIGFDDNRDVVTLKDEGLSEHRRQYSELFDAKDAKLENNFENLRLEFVPENCADNHLQIINQSLKEAERSFEDFVKRRGSESPQMHQEEYFTSSASSSDCSDCDKCEDGNILDSSTNDIPFEQFFDLSDSESDK